MTHDILLHIDETLDHQQQQKLRTALAEQFGIDARAHDSSKPHLLFLPSDPRKAPPHAVLEAVRQNGFRAQLVDL
ncbi:MAG: hypothetical protein R6X15_02210 [Pseudomonadota bacterium]